MRTIDFHQALHVCRLAANVMLAAAAESETGLTDRDRRDLAVIAAAIHAIVEPAARAPAVDPTPTFNPTETTHG